MTRRPEVKPMAVDLIANRLAEVMIGLSCATMRYALFLNLMPLAVQEAGT